MACKRGVTRPAPIVYLLVVELVGGASGDELYEGGEGGGGGAGGQEEGGLGAGGQGGQQGGELGGEQAQQAPAGGHLVEARSRWDGKRGEEIM